MTFDLHQQQCGREGCNAWRLSRPGTEGKGWQRCWKCKTAEPPTGKTFGGAA